MILSPQPSRTARRARAVGAVVTSILLLAALVPVATAADPTNTLVPLQAGATTAIVAQPTGSGAVVDPKTEIPNTDALERSVKVLAPALRTVGPSGIPNPAPQSVSDSNRGFFGFNGVSHYDSRTASGGNQFSLEPPDQGLCVGNGYVVEPVNDVLAVYDTHGSRVAGPEALNAFFGYAPALNRTTGVYGPFLTDPRCLYDAQTNRWFLTELTLEQFPGGGDTGTTHVDIAVSKTGNPTGAWTVFKLYTTNDGTNGTPDHPGCPCLGDQPLIGADSNGFYVSTNEFPFSGGFNGAQIYAMSKSGLAAAATGGSMPAVATINAGALATPDVGGIWYTIQPATSPAGDNAFGNDNGTEYFLSALDFFGTSDNRIAAWALTNTRSLNRATPSVTLANVVIGSESYASMYPWGVTQKAGPAPLGATVHEGLEKIDANDDRMNQVVYADGLLWSGVNTLVGDGSRTGVAYFAVSPSGRHGSFGARMAGQGYVSLAKDSVVYPSIAVNANGNAAMSFTVVGRHYYPSTGYAMISLDHAGPVHIAGAGAGPEDGFSGYVAFGGDGIARWGDYSAAVADEHGNLWLASEYIPGGARTVNANWGTFVSRINP
jgi:hypothetical protein